MLEQYQDVITLEQFKEILHVKSSATAYRMLKNGNFKFIHSRGGKYLILKQSVIDYLLSD